MIYRITVKDEATYELNASDYSRDEAKSLAWELFNERRPCITVAEVSDEIAPCWAVVNPDGTFAGVPCESEEEAEQLAVQEEGRRIFQMAYNATAQVWR